MRLSAGAQGRVYGGLRAPVSQLQSLAQIVRGARRGSSGKDVAHQGLRLRTILDDDAGERESIVPPDDV